MRREPAQLRDEPSWGARRESGESRIGERIATDGEARARIDGTPFHPQA